MTSLQHTMNNHICGGVQIKPEFIKVEQQFTELKLENDVRNKKKNAKSEKYLK